MASVNSTMLPLGTPAPPFDLPDVTTGKTVSIRDFDAKKALLVMFICRHCQYVKHSQFELAKLGRDYANKDIAIVAIQPNDAVAYPDDAPASMKQFAHEFAFVFPVLHDETQDIAKAYTAACTPDFFLFDRARTLVYRGQLDESRPKSGAVPTGRDLRAAIEAVLNDKPVDPNQRPSLGCNIKWKPGNEPPYFSA